ncbi:MAG: hypothetical protein Q9225_001697 [Loekoesia sp. 1 TL-2023]
MSPPSTKEQVFNEIELEADLTDAYDLGVEGYRAFIDQRLNAAKSRFSFMKDVTRKDYSIYQATRDTLRFGVANEGPAPTSKDFWAAAYDYDPHVNAPPSSRKLSEMFSSGRLSDATITIGKLWGQTKLRLVPCFGSLPAQEIPTEPSFHYAPSRCGAISYPDGHPSEDNLRLTIVSESSSRPKSRPVITADEDKVLRRFVSLGWVQMQDSVGQWRKTGHVLVMDMDDKTVRRRQPWLVLAFEWPTDGEETEDGGWTYKADEEVLRGKYAQPGVFPGDENRTPVCSIQPHLPKGAPRSNLPVLKQLGEDFEFAPWRYGGARPVKIKDLGPDLAYVMDWYWDPVNKKEVCYNKDGHVYMCYDPSQKEYSFPDFKSLNVSVVGQQSMFGELVKEEDAPEHVEPRFISLEERQGAPGGPPLPSSSAPVLRRIMESSSVGF